VLLPHPEFELIHVDEFIDELLTSERSCDVILPRIQKRYILEQNEQLETRVSALDEDLSDEEEDDEEEEEEEEEEEDRHKSSQRRRSVSPPEDRDRHYRHREKEGREERRRSRSKERDRDRDKDRERSRREHRRCGLSRAGGRAFIRLCWEEGGETNGGSLL